MKRQKETTIASNDVTKTMHQVTSPKVAPGDARETPCDGHATSGRHLLNGSLAVHRCGWKTPLGRLENGLRVRQRQVEGGFKTRWRMPSCVCLHVCSCFFYSRICKQIKQEVEEDNAAREPKKRKRKKRAPKSFASMASDPTWEGVKEDSGQNRKKNTRAKFTLEVAEAGELLVSVRIVMKASTSFGVHLGSGLRRALPEDGCWD